MKNTSIQNQTRTAQIIPDIFEAEQKLLHFLPKMIRTVTDSGLREKYERYLNQTQEHLKLLKQLSINVI